MAHVCSGLARLVLVMSAVQPSPVTVIVPSTLPVVTAKAVPRLLVYFTESAKYASSAVTRLRRSVFIDAMYAFCLVLANFGIAMAARMPMITTTMSSSINVKPLRFISTSRERERGRNLATVAVPFCDPDHNQHSNPPGVVPDVV